MSGKRLVLFDFDGTITTSDTMFLFTRDAVGALRFLTGMAFLALPLTLHKLGFISAQKAKEIFLTHFFGGMDQSAFNKLGMTFAETRIAAFVRPAAAEAIRAHKQSGSRIVVVSASAQDWMKPWALSEGLEVLATRLEVVDGKITGKITGCNCNGEEKVNRIREHLTLSDFSQIVAYGDTKGDLPMLALATEKHFKPFRDNK
ncbi:MAG TPA: HAD family hydrolase [Cyclobacteriaceae bacterium]|nr:HAD family hydrolase [Cyclobacteriaceae bacterium]